MKIIKNSEGEQITTQNIRDYFEELESTKEDEELQQDLLRQMTKEQQDLCLTIYPEELPKDSWDKIVNTVNEQESSGVDYISVKRLKWLDEHKERKKIGKRFASKQRKKQELLESGELKIDYDKQIPATVEHEGEQFHPYEDEDLKGQIDQLIGFADNIYSELISKQLDPNDCDPSDELIKARMCIENAIERMDQKQRELIKEWEEENGL